MNRNQPYSDINKIFLRMMYEKYLLKLTKQLPKSFMFRNDWPRCSPPLKHV